MNTCESRRINFYVLLTVHLSMILDNDQHDAHLLYFTILPYSTRTILYMFRALDAHLQEVLTVLMQHLVSSSQAVAVQCT